MSVHAHWWPVAQSVLHCSSSTTGLSLFALCCVSHFDSEHRRPATALDQVERLDMFHSLQEALTRRCLSAALTGRLKVKRMNEQIYIQTYWFIWLTCKKWLLSPLASVRLGQNNNTIFFGQKCLEVFLFCYGNCQDTILKCLAHNFFSTTLFRRKTKLFLVHVFRVHCTGFVYCLNDLE